jgi:serralysin
VFRRATWRALAAIGAASLIGASVATAHGVTEAAGTASGSATAGAADSSSARGGTRPHAGPPYHYTTELMGEYASVSIKDQAILVRTKLGYRIWTGQQDSHLVLKLVDGGLLFRDTGTKSFKKLTPKCQRQRVKVGIAAVSRVPRDITKRRPLLVENWPRLGNDFMDASTLPATFAVTMLSDEGNDTGRFGAGPDFFNGHMGRDRVWGGAGNDWIRAGSGNDSFDGGPGNDDLVAMQGRDRVRGGVGDDRVGGSDGNDRLWGGEGTDFVLCGTGSDVANVDAVDRVFHDCESVARQ